MLPIRMFWGSKSEAIDLIIPSIACLDAAYKSPRGIAHHDAGQCLDFYSMYEEVCETYP
jgi:hypothetical protein